MAAADLAVIKDIPGFKIIMKAVLKHQIQQLVEQLSETTGEESILLTASVSDGTLSHLGSESGKNFLDGHDEIKSQFIGFVLKSHHTKKSEKQFASSLGRKSVTPQPLPPTYDDELEAAYTEDTEPHQDITPEPTMTPTRAVGKKKRKVAKSAPSPSDIKTRPKRGAAATKSPLKFAIYIGENEDVEELYDSELEQSESTVVTVTEPGPKETPVKYTEIIPVTGPIPVVPKLDTEDSFQVQQYDVEELSDSEQEQSVSTAATVTEPGPEETPVKYTEIVHASGPTPVVPKLDTEDSFQTQEYDEGSAEFSGAVRGNFNVENTSGKKEVELDIEEGDIIDVEDPDWEPGTKKKRKSSGSHSVTSPVNVSEGQEQTALPQPKVGRKHYPCSYCNKLFPCPSEVSRHERTHTGEKPYTCETCGKLLADKRNLTRHERIHIGEKPYSCEICRKAFAQKGQLKVHNRIHTGDKPYNCVICGKSFTIKGSLISHKIIHTGEKPYSCEICRKDFSHS